MLIELTTTQIMWSGVGLAIIIVLLINLSLENSRYYNELIDLNKENLGLRVVLRQIQNEIDKVADDIELDEIIYTINDTKHKINTDTWHWDLVDNNKQKESGV